MFSLYFTLIFADLHILSCFPLCDWFYYFPMVDFVRFTSLLVLHICNYLGHSTLPQLSLFLDLFFTFWSLIIGMTEDSHYFSWEEMMRPHTLWTRILDTPRTPAIFPSIFRPISNRYPIIL